MVKLTGLSDRFAEIRPDEFAAKRLGRSHHTIAIYKMTIWEAMVKATAEALFPDDVETRDAWVRGVNAKANLLRKS